MGVPGASRTAAPSANGFGSGPSDLFTATAAVVTADTPHAPIRSVEFNSDAAYFIFVDCTFCGGVHRHAWQANDPELSRVLRESVCGAGSYVFVGLERVIA